MKKKFSRIIALILAILMVAAMFTACNRDDDDDDDDDDKTSHDAFGKNDENAVKATQEPVSTPGEEPSSTPEVTATPAPTPEPEVTPVPHTGGTLYGTYYLAAVNDGTVRDYFLNEMCEGDEDVLALVLAMLGLTEDTLGTMMYFEFNSDGTGTVYALAESGGNAVHFTWTQDGETVTCVNEDGETDYLTVVNSDYFYLDTGEDTLYFGR